MCCHTLRGGDRHLGGLARWCRFANHRLIAPTPPGLLGNLIGEVVPGIEPGGSQAISRWSHRATTGNQFARTPAPRRGARGPRYPTLRGLASKDYLAAWAASTLARTHSIITFTSSPVLIKPPAKAGAG